ncbi:GMP synthase PP-ATPase domain protein [Mycoplasmoides gallisepticum str. R(low)]|uniref:Glutamine amidotransferase n=2 Tax=Mycoplasmoides gallisepticum TaxID=2096 RepID=Q7NC61_MYCGA|nr:GMP synthase [Mycoplasmoides gallisepticum]AAP56369.1 GMP synthase PP-ATPase domain protein [Mycoplasmoides gallisepticum str. R(low)]ADC30201.1 GMP synthase PP-ATPase domain protein [Mycoplasmoides gallisepticum str. R(high)]QEX45568.1 GMP synthase [Mycoplasmoides gallisepticum]
MQARKLQDFLISTVTLLRDTIKNKKAIIPLNGGVFSFVLAKITKIALNKNLICIYIDNGMMRHNEVANKINFFREKLDLEVWHIDAKELFLNNLKGHISYADKKKAIDDTFLEVVIQTIVDIGEKIDFALLGTCFDDLNQGLNISMALTNDVYIFEPLKQLTIQQVIELGELLSIDPNFLKEPTLPLSGFGLMVEDEVTEEKIVILKKVYYLINTILNQGLQNKFEISIRDDYKDKSAYNLYIEFNQPISDLLVKKVKDQINGLLSNIKKIFIKV